MCHPILKYAAEIWEGQISGEWSKRLERVQYLFGKAVLGLHSQLKPSASGVLSELGVLPLRLRPCGPTLVVTLVVSFCLLSLRMASFV